MDSAVLVIEVRASCRDALRPRSTGQMALKELVSLLKWFVPWPGITTTRLCTSALGTAGSTTVKGSVVGAYLVICILPLWGGIKS